MLSKAIISLETEKPAHWNMGSLMQGVIMENISTEYAQKLHNEKINPYAQYIHSDKSSSEWVISALNEEADKQIVKKIIAGDLKKIYLSHRDETLKVTGIKYSCILLQQLMESTYFGQCGHWLTLSFDTPTAFKTQGKYQFYPTVFHVFQSLIMKYDSVITDNRIYSDEIMRQIEENIEVKNYSLRSTNFSLEGLKIPAFRGTVQIKIQGPQMFCNLIHLLAKFGEYSGVGIKTAMGMGAMHIIRKASPVISIEEKTI